MKKSYIKIIIFTFVFILVFLLNSFVFKFFSQFSLDILLVFLLFIVYFLFGFEKDRHRYTKNVILEILIFMISFFLIYYFFGIFIGLAKTVNLSISFVLSFILPLIFYIIIKEFLRYQLLQKASESKILISLVCIFFICLDNTIVFASHSFSFNREMFLVLALTFLPSLMENILCTFMSLKVGYFPCIIYLLLIKLYFYVMPIVPNPSEYVYSLVFFLLPCFLMWHVNRFLLKDRTNDNLDNGIQKRKFVLLCYVPLILIVSALVYFISGYFRYYAIAIASGSMEKTFSKGDVVIVDKMFNDLNNGDIIAYYYENKIIVHRICNIIKNDDDYFVYTKGDANLEMDNYKITKDMVIGKVYYVIPLIGYPTVYLNEKW